MVSQWWSIALTVIGVTGVLCVALKRWYGFVVGVAVQVLWIVYAVTTRQWGFIGSAIAYGIVNGLGWYRWARDRRKAVTEPLRGRVRHPGVPPVPRWWPKYEPQYNDDGTVRPEVIRDAP